MATPREVLAVFDHQSDDRAREAAAYALWRIDPKAADEAGAPRPACLEERW